MGKYQARYLKLAENGEIEHRVTLLKEKLKSCTVCPHHCQVNRLENKRGFCQAGTKMVISAYGPHFGEEGILVGEGGSGTIFFSHCTLRCVFCQNYEISHKGEGYKVSPQELARIMLALQRRGCHNINLVSPSHFVPQIVEALSLAIKDGLTLPLVYNTGGYDDIETLKLLDGIIDIYMPDIKFGNNEKAKKYTKVTDYFDIATAAVKEMYRQVGNLKLDDRGIACSGLLIRHLVMPDNLADTEKVLDFIAAEHSKDTAVNIMNQYYPAHQAYLYPELGRRISRQEYYNAIEYAEKLGLTNTRL